MATTDERDGLAADDRPRRKVFDALSVPDFRRFWLAALASNSGSWLQGIATPFVLFELTGSGAWVGASVFSIMLPMAIMGPIAGPLADRVSRRKILMVAQSCQAALALVYAIIWWSGVTEPLAYVGLGVIYGFFNGFSMPAWQAYVSDLVPRHLLMNAITLNSAQFNAARAIGPSIGGVVLALFGPGASFLGNALSFLVVVGTLVTLPPTVPSGGGQRGSSFAQFAAGWRYARTQPSIMTAYLVAFLIAVCGGTLVQVHVVLFAEQVFGATEFFYGLLFAAFGVGAVLAAPWLGANATRMRASRVLLVGLVGYGLGELLLTSTSLYVVGLLGLLLAGASHITAATATNTTVQLMVADDMRGRVLSMYLMTLTVGMPVAALVQGPLADRFGVRPVVSVMGLMFLAGAALLALTGRVNEYDRAGARPSDNA